MTLFELRQKTHALAQEADDVIPACRWFEANRAAGHANPKFASLCACPPCEARKKFRGLVDDLCYLENMDWKVQ